MPVRFLHVADLHLGRAHDYLGDRAPERRREADALLDRLVDLALDPARDIAGVLIAGDLFESESPDKELVGRVLAALRRLLDYGRFLLTVPGNHDEYTYPHCVYRTYGEEWPGVLVRRPDPGHVHTARIGGVPFHFYGMAYTASLSKPPYETFEKLDEPGRHVGVFHASLDADWSDRSVPLKGEALAKVGLDYLALGHIHRPARKQLGKTLAVYPGALEGNGFADPGTDHVTVVEFDEGRVEARDVQFPTRRIRTVELDLTSLPNREALQNEIAKLVFPELVLRVRLVGLAGFDPSAEFLRGLFAPRCYHFELIDETRLLDSQRMASLAGERTIQGLFVRQLREGLEAAEDERERRVRDLALRYGLQAFGEERT